MIIDKIINYYQGCHPYYRFLLGIDRNASLHLGFHDSGYIPYKKAAMDMNYYLAKFSNITSRDTIIDFGCGAGSSCLWLAKECGVKVTGIDINPLHIELARKISGRHNLDTLAEFRTADFLNTGLPADSFDVVWSIESIGYALDKKLFFQEAIRLLRENGRLIFADGFPSKKHYTEDEYRYLEKIKRRATNTEFLTKSDYYALLKSAGFKDIRYADITSNVLPSSRRLYFISLCLSPILILLKMLGPRHDGLSVALNNAYGLHNALKRGILRYGVFCAEKHK